MDVPFHVSVPARDTLVWAFSDGLMILRRSCNDLSHVPLQWATPAGSIHSILLQRPLNMLRLPGLRSTVGRRKACFEPRHT